LKVLRWIDKLVLLNHSSIGQINCVDCEILEEIKLGCM